MTDKLITMIVPFYNQPRMLEKQLDTWADYSNEVRDAIRFVVVDDCTPEPWTAKYTIAGRMIPDFPVAIDLQLYRIDEDVEWNRGMARNLGTKMATTPWVLHVDTDHILGADSAAALAANVYAWSKDCWYRFRRFRMGRADETRMKDKIPRDAAYGEIHPHIDSYLCTPEAYWKAGGYNEDFSGVLGGGTPFLKEMERVNGPASLSGISLDVYTRDAVPDSSEHTLPRSPEAFKKRKQEIMKARGTLRGHDPIRLPWHRVF